MCCNDLADGFSSEFSTENRASWLAHRYVPFCEKCSEKDLDSGFLFYFSEFSLFAFFRITSYTGGWPMVFYGGGEVFCWFFRRKWR